MRQVRLLAEADHEELDTLLRQDADNNVLLRSNLSRGGLTDEGELYQATYAGSFDGGVMNGVVAPGWNGAVLLNIPDRCQELLLQAEGVTGRAITVVIGTERHAEWPREVDQNRWA